MTLRFSKTCIHAAILLSTMILSMQAVKADRAIVMGRSICDNQADSFDYRWITSKVDDTKLFFLSGDTAASGTINAVGHAGTFNALNEIYVAVHGAVNVVDAFSGTDFAALFLSNHKDTPDSVTFYVCESGTPPQSGTSSMAAVARKYPGLGENSTSIGAVNAPASNMCPALAVNSANTPFNPVEDISAAVYRTNVSHTDKHEELLRELEKAWSDENDTPYPGTEQSYASYCQSQLAGDPTGAWLLAFIANAADEFGDRYLALVNTNYGGNDLKTCGQCD